MARLEGSFLTDAGAVRSVADACATIERYPGLATEKSGPALMLWSYPEAASHMSPWQFALLRLRASHSERTAEQMLKKASELAWIFANPVTHISDHDTIAKQTESAASTR